MTRLEDRMWKGPTGWIPGDFRHTQEERLKEVTTKRLYKCTERKIGPSRNSRHRTRRTGHIEIVGRVPNRVPSRSYLPTMYLLDYFSLPLDPTYKTCGKKKKGPPFFHFRTYDTRSYVYGNIHSPPTHPPPPPSRRTSYFLI